MLLESGRVQQLGPHRAWRPTGWCSYVFGLHSSRGWSRAPPTVRLARSGLAHIDCRVMPSSHNAAFISAHGERRRRSYAAWCGVNGQKGGADSERGQTCRWGGCEHQARESRGQQATNFGYAECESVVHSMSHAETWCHCRRALSRGRRLL